MKCRLWVICFGIRLALCCAAQEEAVEETVPDPVWTVSRAGGLVVELFDLTVACDAAESVLHFTQDGSMPTVESAVWEGGTLRIEETTVIRCIAVVDEGIVSRFGAAYLFVEPEVVRFESNLPVVVVDSFGVDINRDSQSDSRSEKRPVWAVFGERGAEMMATPNFSGRAGMRVRGQTSTMFPKKQYSLELWDEEDDDLDASLLGLPEESDWVLHAPYSDKTLMRNVLAYQWFREMGHYAVQTMYVELFYNADGDAVSMDDYVGVYVLMEKIKRDKGRLPIAKLEETMIAEPEISGGYIFKKDKGTHNDVHFNTRAGHLFGFVEPDEPNEAQMSYLSGYLDSFERALYGPGFASEGEGYAKYIDVPSFIDVHIHVEICRNIDGFRLSTYYHKDREGKVVMGPVWDYNLSLGNTTMRGGEYPDGWYHDSISRRDYTYFDRLFQDPLFELQHWDRYYQLRQSVFATDKLMAQIDSIAKALGEAQERNFQQWPILGQPEWQNPEGAWDRKTHADEVAWLKNWLSERLDWLDRQFMPPPVIEYGGEALASGAGVTLMMSDKSGDRSRIYYTLDGSDPRASSGMPGSGAVVMSPGSDAIVTQSVTLKARAFKASAVKSSASDGRQWGALSEVAIVVDPSLAPIVSRSSGMSRRAMLLLAVLGAFLIAFVVKSRDQ